MFIVCPKCVSKYRIPPEITLKEGQKVQCSACQHVFNFESKKDQTLNESSVVGIQIPDNPVLSQTVIHKEKIVYNHDLPDAFKPLAPVPNQSFHFWGWLLVCLGFFVFVLCGIWLYRDMLKTDYISFSESRQVLPRVPQKTTARFVNETLQMPEKKDNQLDIKDIPFLFEDENKLAKNSKTIPQCDAFSFHSVRFRHEGKNLLISGIIQNDTNALQTMPDSIFASAYDNQGKILFQKEIFLPNEVLLPYTQKAFYGTYAPADNNIQWMEVTCKN